MTARCQTSSKHFRFLLKKWWRLAPALQPLALAPVARRAIAVAVRFMRLCQC